MAVKPKIAYGALVGKVIEHRRRQLGVHQTSIAAALGVTQSAYSRLEKGQTSMSVTQLQIVSTQLHTTSADLLKNVERFAAQLRSQGAEITDEKQQDTSAAGLLIALGILAALLAASS